MRGIQKIGSVNRLGLGSDEGVLNRNKALSVRFNKVRVAKNINLRTITIYLEVSANNLSSQDATIYVIGKQEALPSTMIPAIRKNIRKDGVTQVEVVFFQNILGISNSIELDDIYTANVVCDGLVAESVEFRINLADTDSGLKTCFCNRPFSDSEFKNIIIELRKQEVYIENGKLVRDSTGEPLLKNGKRQFVDITMYDEIGEDLFDLDYPEKIRKEDANFKKFTEAINKALKDYEINSCIRKIHFLAQCYHETQRFTLTYEKNPSSTVSGGSFYRGRGLIQLTHDYNYEKLRQKVNDNSNLSAFAPRVAQEIDLACQASGYYWKNLGIVHKDINTIADKDDVLTVSKEINGYGGKNGIPNGFNDRKLFTNFLKEIFDYENCKNKK